MENIRHRFRSLRFGFSGKDTEPPAVVHAEDPRFPAELERAIFETAALLHPASIPGLLRVSRRVTIWIQPILYRVVRVNSRNGALVRFLLTSGRINPRRPDHPLTLVRHLCLETVNSYCTVHDGRWLVELCSGVVNLGLNFGFADPALLPILGKMRIKHLAVNLRVLFGNSPIDFEHPLFSSITHLSVFHAELVASVILDVALLPALTHLSLDSHLPRELVLSILPVCQELRVLLVVWHWSDKESYIAARSPCVYDERFVIALYQDFWGVWEDSARAIRRPWLCAEELIAQKRKGEIEETRYWLTDSSET
ncbi:tyrosinase central domain-containing protein [Favolaschia claudopus]|uniref:Tyrosinase central domain-containing protein n=1 Tax=Favolaschia claudopus TaxID=2862362 RepID=A0AAW0BMI4_9AGAR